MSARISISVDYKEIPSESNYIINRSLSRIETVVESIKQATSEDNIQRKLEIIDRARKELIMADANLEDSYQILLAYAKNELESVTPKGEQTKNEQ
jgi:hypothetical protein